MYSTDPMSDCLSQRGVRLQRKQLPVWDKSRLSPTTFPVSDDGDDDDDEGEDDDGGDEQQMILK